MSEYILDIEGFDPIMGILEEETAAEKVQLYRWPHDVERQNFDDDNEFNGLKFRGPGDWSGPVRGAVINAEENPLQKPMPEVYRVLPDQTTPLYDWAIRLWRAMNPNLSDNTFVGLLDNKLWLTNGTGWPGRRNIILNKDMNRGFPTFHAPVVTGGALFKGREVNGWLEIENIRYNEPVTLEYVEERPWLWFYGTTVTRTGRVNMFTRNHRVTRDPIPVRVPFITKNPVRVPLPWLHKLEPGYIPNIPHINVNKYALSTGSVTGQF